MISDGGPSAAAMDEYIPADVDAIATGEQSKQLEQLEPTVEPCVHFNGGSEFDGPTRLRYLKKRFPEAYKELDDLREEVVGSYVRGVTREGFKSTKKYNSEVFIYRDDKQRVRMLDRLRDNALGYPGRLLLWVDEGDHIHVVHDCPYSNGQCRCYFGKNEDFRRSVRNPLRRLRYLSEMDTIDWSNVFLYFVLSKWKNNPQVWIGGRLQGLPSGDKIVRWQRLQRKSREILDREKEGVRYYDSSEDGSNEDDRQSISTRLQEVGKKRSIAEKGGLRHKRTKFERISETVQTLLNDYFCIPANHIKDILINDDRAHALYDPSNEKCYAAACDLFTKRFNKFKLNDFAKLYQDKEPVFYSNSINPFEYYHDIETSVKYINDLLVYQFGDNPETIAEFLFNVKSWFDGDGWYGNPKLNCICIVGAPNSGKNYFWDMLAALAYNVGHIGRVNNKTNQFALQECYGRRMVMGNEISMEEGAKEDFKKLCEGTAFNIRVKYQGDKIFTKAPVCLISNFMLDICSDPHFKNVRLHTLRWLPFDYLKHSKKKPYPLCIFDLFDKYKVQL